MNNLYLSKLIYKGVWGCSLIVLLGMLACSFSTQAYADKKTSKAQSSHSETKSLNVVKAEPESLNITKNEEIIIDSVVASVDGVPITLREISERVVPKRKVNLTEFSQDSNLTKVLDAIIMERLIEAEASSRRLKASPEDIARYIEQVAAQNNLSRTEFEEALSKQGKSLEEFKVQARLEILRSRLMGQVAQSAPAVTDDELGESSVEEKEEQSESDQKIRFHLQEIVLLKKQGNEEEIALNSEQISERLKAGEDFSAIARELSQGATAQSGGDLGELAEEDLSEAIRDGISGLSSGEHSEAIDMTDAIRFFLLDKKYEEGESSDFKSEQKEQLRKQLETRKLEKRLEEFFTIELPKLHKVERKV